MGTFGAGLRELSTYKQRSKIMLVRLGRRISAKKSWTRVRICLKGQRNLTSFNSDISAGTTWNAVLEIVSLSRIGNSWTTNSGKLSAGTSVTRMILASGWSKGCAKYWKSVQSVSSSFTLFLTIASISCRLRAAAGSWWSISWKCAKNKRWMFAVSTILVSWPIS